MNFNEKLIFANIGDLAMKYDCIHGANINIARITPELIDGFKPVQRRIIWIMRQTDGGKHFRKLASITGEVFGKCHPHCLHGDTKFVFSDGLTRSIDEIYAAQNTFDSNGRALFTLGSVKSFNTETDSFENDDLYNVRITKWVREYYEIEFTTDGNNTSTIKCTEDHPLLLHRDGKKWHKWTRADEVEIGDIIVSHNDKKDTAALVTGVHIIKEDHDIPMYDFTVDKCGCIGVDDGDGGYIIVKNSPTAIDEAAVLMVQKWRNIIPLLEGSGNFGGISGDCAGASRYIQARLSPFCIDCFFNEMKDAVLEMELGSDEKTLIPKYLPSKYPVALLNGCLGIGFGLSANIPCFNFREVVEATILLMHRPKANIILIPDSATGADIINTDFALANNTGKGSYTQRCTFEIDDKLNMITITSLPELTTAKDITEKIADIKLNKGLPELIQMNDHSGARIQIELLIRDDVNPHKFMKKLIKQVAGLERSYPVTITVSNDYQTFDLSVKDVLLGWIDYRREYKRTLESNKRTRLTAELRAIDVKIFIMNKDNLKKTINLFQNSRNAADIERKLIEEYHNTPIRMDSLQARAISNMRMSELTIEEYEKYCELQKELTQELNDLDSMLKVENGIDKIIIAELREGLKKYGVPRRSNVVPYEISVSSEVEGNCILQLSSDGMILRKQGTNAEEEPIPTDSNGFACLVNNDSSFILVDDKGYCSFIKVNEIPLDVEVPVNRYSKKPLDGKIVALLPFDIESNKCCTLISRKGILKRIKISEMTPGKKPCIAMDSDDLLVKGIVLSIKSHKELLVYTDNGMGQRFDPNGIRITSPNAKGGSGFKLAKDDMIVGCYAISPESNQYLLYCTQKGKTRLNNIEFLPVRDSKHDKMVQLISLNERDKLISVLGCNKYDKAEIYFDDNKKEVLDLKHLEESTMSTPPKKSINKDMKSAKVIKVRII